MNQKLKSILLIDDDFTTNFYNEVILKQVKCAEEIIKVESAQAALDLLVQRIQNQQALPDLIFLDINMPIMSGWDFIDRYKSLDEDAIKHVQVVMLTSSISGYDKEKAKEIELIKHFQTKPLSTEIVKQILKKCFGQKENPN